MMGGAFPAIGFAGDPAVPITVEQAAGAGPGWPFRFLPVKPLLEVSGHTGDTSRWDAPMSTASINPVSLNRHGEVRLFEMADWRRPGIEHGFGPYAGTRLDRFSLFHNSIALFANDTLGPGWTHSGDIQLHTWREAMGRSLAAVLWGNGNVQLFERQGNGYMSLDPYRDVLSRERGEFVLTLKNGMVVRFERVTGSTKSVVSSIEDPNGNSSTFAYDGLNRLSRISDPHGRTLDLSYTGDGRLAQLFYAFAGAVRVADITYGGGELRTVARPPATLGPAAATEPILVQSNQIQAGEIPGPPRDFREYRYDSLGNIAQETDPLGNVTRYSYDDRGLREVLSALGHSKRYALSAGEFELEDERGVQTFLNLDDLYRLIEIRNAAGAVTTIEHSNEAYQYSPSRILSPLNVKVEFAYDMFANPIAVTDSRGNLTRFEYDAFNRLTKEIRPVVTGNSEPRQSTFTYDGAGNPLSVGQSLGAGNERVTSFTYDALGNVTSRTDAGGAITRYSFNANGNLIEMVDPVGRTFTWEFLNAERTHLFTRPATVVTGEGHRTELRYDGNGRMVRQDTQIGTIVETVDYFRDPLGRLAEMRDPSGTTRWTYNADGRVTSEDKEVDAAADPAPASYTVSYEHLPNGLIAEIALFSAGRQIEFSYDALNRLQRIIHGSDWQAREYNDDDQPVLVENSNGTTSSYEWENGVLRRIMHFDQGGAAFSDYHSRRDEEGRITQTTDQTGETFLEFDLAGHLISERRISGGAEAYSFVWDFDQNGDRTREQRAFAGTTGLREYSFDLDGRAIGVSSPGSTLSIDWDGSGNLSGAATPGSPPVDFVHNARNLLTRVQQDEFAVLRKYDGLDRPVVQEVSQGATVVELRQYVHAGGALLQERTESGDVYDVVIDPNGTIVLQTQNSLKVVPHEDGRGFFRNYTGASGDLLSLGDPSRNGYGEPLGTTPPALFPFIAHGQVRPGLGSSLQGFGAIYEPLLATPASIVGEYFHGRRAIYEHLLTLLVVDQESLLRALQPPGHAGAGIYAATDVQRGVAKVPAGAIPTFGPVSVTNLQVQQDGPAGDFITVNGDVR